MVKLHILKLEQDLSKNQDLLVQYRSQFEQLDQMLEQFQDQTKALDLEWELNYENGRFWFGFSSDLINVQLRTNQIEKILKPHYLKQIIEIATLISKQIEKDDKPWYFYYNFDENRLNVEYHGSYCAGDYDLINLHFDNVDFNKCCDLLKTCFAFANASIVQIDQQLTSDKAFDLQLLKLIIDQSINDKAKVPKRLLQWCQNELSKPDCTHFSFKNNLYKATELENENRICQLEISDLDWYFNIDFKKEQFVIDFAMYDMNANKLYQQFKPVTLTFNQAAKLANDPQFANIFKMWKSYSQTVDRTK